MVLFGISSDINRHTTTTAAMRCAPLSIRSKTKTGRNLIGKDLNVLAVQSRKKAYVKTLGTAIPGSQNVLAATDCPVSKPG